ncbi:MAG TPA: SDR family oxidoreductase [Sphingobacterium sp.]|nr:SDR family oxidoreductase [Sphingobacterium sp.]
MDSSQKTVLISGGLGDIGRAIALTFGRKGFRVALGDILEETEADRMLEEMHSEGCKELFYYQVDVTSEDETASWLDAVTQKWGVPQVIVPNAGIVIGGSLTDDDLTTAQARQQLDVNFWGSYHLAVQVAKKLKANQLPGSIVFIGSWTAERPNTRISSYCISKAAVRMLCKTLALELASHRILVNEIAPGIVSGGLSKKNQQKDPNLLKAHLNAIPVHDLVTVEKVAKHVLWLSDFEDINITGSTLLVDGGLSLTSKLTP